MLRLVLVEVPTATEYHQSAVEVVLISGTVEQRRARNPAFPALDLSTQRRISEVRRFLGGRSPSGKDRKGLGDLFQKSRRLTSRDRQG
jgi:hypothetical protein